VRGESLDLTEEDVPPIESTSSLLEGSIEMRTPPAAKGNAKLGHP
jgi:hypothetical protein